MIHCCVLGSSLSNNTGFNLDYDRILANIEELNALAGEGVGQVQHGTDGARIKVALYCSYQILL